MDLIRQQTLLRAIRDASFAIENAIVSPNPDTSTGFQIALNNFNTTAAVLGLSTGSNVSYADLETPSGTINGSNTTFTLTHTPNPSVSLQLYENGIMQRAGVDYTLSGSTITMTQAPMGGSSPDTLVAFYRF